MDLVIELHLTEFRKVSNLASSSDPNFGLISSSTFLLKEGSYKNEILSVLHQLSRKFPLIVYLIMFPRGREDLHHDGNRQRPRRQHPVHSRTSPSLRGAKKRGLLYVCFHGRGL